MRVFPINALLPKQEVINDVVSLGSGKLPESNLIEKAQKSQYSYLRIVKPQFIDPELIPGSEEFYNSSLNHFHHLMESELVTKFPKSIFFYEQSHHSGVNLGGWVLGIDGDDYLEGKVKRHENTLRAKEDRLVKHIKVLNSMAEPVLLSQILPDSLSQIASNVKLAPPHLEVMDEFQNTHKVWVIQDDLIQVSILNEFSNLDSLYIADGHHRVASSSRFLVDEFGHNSGKGFMALVMNETDLLIKPFYRIVKTDHKFDVLISFLKENGFSYTEMDITNFTDYSAVPFRSVCCFSKEKALLIQLPNISLEKAVDQLDVTLTEKTIFGPAFNIKDTAHDQNIRFLRGDTSISKVMGFLLDNEIGFLFHSNTMAEIRAVADEESIMPPKSTFIEPKLLTGFIVETY